MPITLNLGQRAVRHEASRPSSLVPGCCVGKEEGQRQHPLRRQAEFFCIRCS
jgi:hypothetical protein